MECILLWATPDFLPLLECKLVIVSDLVQNVAPVPNSLEFLAVS